MSYATSEKEPKNTQKEKTNNWKIFDLDSLDWQGNDKFGLAEAKTKFGTLYSLKGNKYIEINGKQIWLTDKQAKYFAVTGKTEIPYKEDIKKELSNISLALQKSKETKNIIYLENPNPNDKKIETLAIYPPEETDEHGHKDKYLVVNQKNRSKGAFYHSSYGDETIAKQINKIFKKHDYSDLSK